MPAARELAQFGIRVLAIAPGVFETPMMEGVNETLRESLVGQIPFPRHLVNSLRERFGFGAAPIRLELRSRRGERGR